MCPENSNCSFANNRSGSFFLFWSRGTSESLNWVRLHHNDAKTAAAAATTAAVDVVTFVAAATDQLAAVVAVVVEVVTFVAAATDQLAVVAVAAAADDQLTFIAAVSKYLQSSSMLSCSRVGCCSCLFPIESPRC